MAFKYATRIRESSVSTGSGPFTLAGAVDTTYKTVSSALSDGDISDFRIRMGDDWVSFEGTYNSGAGTISVNSIWESSAGGSAVTFGAGTKDIILELSAKRAQRLFDAAGVNREKLSADRTYYVRTDGSDSNTGLVNSSGGAFLTLDKARQVVESLDIAIYTVTVQIGDGTYTAGTTFTGPPVGSGSIVIQGNSGTPANVLLSVTSADAIVAQSNARLTVKDLKITTATSGYSLRAKTGANVFWQNTDFGAAATGHIRSDDGAVMTATGNYAITGGSGRHWNSVGTGQIICFGKTITITGTPAFSAAFALATTVGILRVDTNTFSGSATGVRYSSDGNSVISTGAGGATYLPGNAAGGVTNGGLYL
jgi:hypothetical protein